MEKKSLSKHCNDKGSRVANAIIAIATVVLFLVGAFGLHHFIITPKNQRQVKISSAPSALVSKSDQGVKISPAPTRSSQNNRVENYYAVTRHLMKGSSGNAYAMHTITKVFSEKNCNEVIKQKGVAMGSWVSAGGECMRGSDDVTQGTSFDKWVGPMFENQPISGLYISFTDLNGFETRMKIVGLAGQNSPLPGYPTDLPVNESAKTAGNEIVNSLSAAGIKNAKVIYPKE